MVKSKQAKLAEVSVEVLGGNTEVMAELHRVYARDGELRIDVLVAESKKQTSPLYIAPKDAEEAGREFLVRKLVGRFYIEITNEEVSVRQRRWISVEKGDSRAYVAAEDVARNKTFREAYRERLIEQMRQLKSALERFDEFLPLARMIEQILQKSA